MFSPLTPRDLRVDMRKLGVFICHCGVNIAGTVDVKSVAEKIGRIEDVAHSTDYIYMCSEPGQQTIREAIREKGLDGVVVACCSPSMHENTFRKAVKSQGMNPYLCEIANIREQCSWVHQKEKGEATQKAEEIIQATLEKVRRNESLETICCDHQPEGIGDRWRDRRDHCRPRFSRGRV